jgi:hypothetical protein
MVSLMHTTRRSLRLACLAVLILSLSSVPNAAAQLRHTVDRADLAAIAAGELRVDAVRRDQVRRVLARAEVQTVASRMGVDASTLGDHLALLADADLERAAAAAAQVDEALVGGQSTIVNSTTTIVLILLLILLILVVAD